jgi:hypothetical protein
MDMTTRPWLHDWEHRHLQDGYTLCRELLPLNWKPTRIPLLRELYSHLGQVETVTPYHAQVEVTREPDRYTVGVALKSQTGTPDTWCLEYQSLNELNLALDRILQLRCGYTWIPYRRRLV